MEYERRDNFVPNPKTSNKILVYGCLWDKDFHPVKREMEMIQNGGKWKRSDGTEVGNGLEFHFRKFQELIWPKEKIWHRWNILEMECFLKYTYIGEMGCAAAGKSNSAASNFLADWYCFPDCTTTLVSSTDIASLKIRAWGMIVEYHRAAKKRFPWLPGTHLRAERKIVFNPTDNRKDNDERNAVIGIPCKRGTTYVGLSNYVGIHNKRVRLLADECNMMPRAFLDSTSNLSKCEDFKLSGLGNPNETTNAHGILCEPATELGGWQSGIDQKPKTKIWKTNFPNGICIQLRGSDTPNNDFPNEIKFPFLITKQHLDNDAKIWGETDWHYLMFDESIMPTGQGSRRIITRQECEKFGATNEPFWKDSNQTYVAFLDAAFRGAGGDRCIFGVLKFGPESEPPSIESAISNLITQPKNAPQGRQIIALSDILSVPITSDDLPEDQIVKFVREQCISRGISPANFFFDAGMRTSLVQAFSRLWSVDVNSIDFGGKPSDMPVSAEIKTPCHEYYSKFVTELWYSFRLCVESRQFRGLTQDAMWEFTSREWKTVGNNKIEVETKAEMKLKSGKSPDLADAICCGLYGARKLGFVIAKLQPPPEYRPRGKDWRTDVRKMASIWKSGQLSSTT